MNFVQQWSTATWSLLADSAIYVLFGLLIGGLLKVFLSPATVVRHLGRGRFLSVFKAALLGIPMPLCSCGVLPAGASLRRQGANRGATTAFLISTPETGVDSIAITYALLGPIMTIARPVAAFATAAVAGVAENLSGWTRDRSISPDLSCPVDGCCDGTDCDETEHSAHHSFGDKLWNGMKFAVGDLWADLVGWFMVGMLLAGLITVLVPDHVMQRYLGGGSASMLLMLLVGIPLYICATASTPVAAALILKGVSPGTALVFLLAGPATNITSLSVVVGVLGKRATVIYLASIAVMSVLAGLILDGVIAWLGVSAQVTAGRATEMVPAWLAATGAALLLVISVKPLFRKAKGFAARMAGAPAHDHHHGHDHDHDHGACGEPAPGPEPECSSGST